VTLHNHPVDLSCKLCFNYLPIFCTFFISLWSNLVLRMFAKS